MSPRTDIILGVIAFAVLAIAIAQVGVVVLTGLAARRGTRLAETVERA